jgi:hypothetical protein
MRWNKFESWGGGDANTVALQTVASDHVPMGKKTEADETQVRGNKGSIVSVERHGCE